MTDQTRWQAVVYCLSVRFTSVPLLQFGVVAVIIRIVPPLCQLYAQMWVTRALLKHFAKPSRIVCGQTTYDSRKHLRPWRFLSSVTDSMNPCEPADSDQMLIIGNEAILVRYLLRPGANARRQGARTLLLHHMHPLSLPQYMGGIIVYMVLIRSLERSIVEKSCRHARHRCRDPRTRAWDEHHSMFATYWP